MATRTDGLKIERVPLESLHPDPANARTHDERSLEAIQGSLARFGQQKPIVVDRGRVIRAGNGTYEAAKALGWKTIDVVVTDLEGIEATAYSIADNRTTDLSAFEPEALGRLLKELRAEDALDGVGYGTEEIDALLAELAQSTKAEVEDPGPGEPPENPIARTGDLWVLGDHRLLAGDSTSADDIARVMDGDVADLLSTDPPYCVNYTGKDRPIHDGKPSGKDWSHVYREVDIKDLGEFLDGVLNACLGHVDQGAAIYLWHAHVQQPTIAAVFDRHDLLLHQVIVWVKPCGVFGHSYYRWRHEPCAFGWRRGHKPTHGTGKLDTVWEADWDGKARFTGSHPTTKPTRLFEIPMEQHTGLGAIVLEPFSGSGSQLIAAEKLGRRCRAIEIQPAFVDVAIKRWEQATGRQAILDGRTFTQIEEEGR